MFPTHSRQIIYILPLLLATVLHSSAAPVLDIDFTAAEGFSDGASLNGIQSMQTQPAWVAGNTAGSGFATCSSAWTRALNTNSFMLAVGESVVIETTLRLNDADAIYSNADNFELGFAEQSVHAGASTPSIGATLHTLPDGSYWFGGHDLGSRLSVAPANNGDWIRFTQSITRSASTNTFTGTVSATNLTAGTSLGTTSAVWTETTADGSWGGTMRPSFRVWENTAATALEIDRWTVYTVTNTPPPPPPVVTNTTGPVSILVDPEASVAIGGHLNLDRRQFFNLSDSGRTMESKVNNAAQVSYYINDLGMYFGRELGGAYGVIGWNAAAVKEDAARPGYVDMTNLANKLNPNNGGSSSGFMSHFGPNLNVAMHDRYNTVPSFMPTWVATGDNPSHTHAVNTDAYGEFIAGILQNNYTSWTRPATYEIVNEPDWRVWGDQRFADLHTAVKSHVNSAGLNVAIGGPCMSVGYFYKNNYSSFSMKNFIDNTACNLDFYSFHVYDYMQWDAAATNFNGRVSTGLPIEGVLDLIESYTRNQYGKNVDIVLSEHGGYISTDQEIALDTIANTYFPGSGFTWEMKRRSVSERLAVSSEIANTMAFMNNPHVVRKSVPFILLESASWNPRYYSTLLVKQNFDKNSNVWVESTYVNFYKFFRNVSGRRVRTVMNDPDLQCQAYVNGSKLYILINNLARKAEELALDVPSQDIQSILVRRFGRNADFTPFFTETAVGTLAGLQIGEQEALAIEVNYLQSPSEKLVLDETPYYSSLYQQQFSGSQTFNVAVANPASARSALLRIGVGRGTGTDRDLQVVFNGTPLAVPLEDCADYLENSSEYGSTKLVPVPVSLLQANNSVQISWPNGGYGGIGAVVLRVAEEQSTTGPVYSEWARLASLSGTNSLRGVDADADGFDNFNEFVSGTDPLSSGSLPSAMSFADAGGFRVSIDSKAQRLYTIETTDNLLNGWSTLTNNVPGTGGQLDIVDAYGASNRFYRVKVQLQ